ncbi:hypothetical protein [Streptomyces sp. NPDC001410]|uniref:hypothetical protein n=1 Tax=Streptomyces sp. NPDC001410 TaxID=3364574 RepID=UPI0036C98267
MSSGSPPATYGNAASPAWVPPTEIEQALFDAKSREDWAAYFDTLALEPLYFEIQRDKADAYPDKSYSVLQRLTQ